MVMGLNLHKQGTWTKAVYNGGGGPVGECTVECTPGRQFCSIHPKWQPGVANKKKPNRRFMKIPKKTTKLQKLKNSQISNNLFFDK